MKKLTLVLGIVLVFGSLLFINTRVSALTLIESSDSLLSAAASIPDRVATLERQVAQLFDQIAHIQLTPGPQGPIGPVGPQGPAGTPSWDEARIVALEARVAALENPPPPPLPQTNLVSYWKFDETAGATTAADAKGTNTLAQGGSATFATGKFNNATDLEAGTSDYWSIADGSQSGLDLATDFSISMWVKLDSQPNGDFTLASKRDGGNGYSIYYSSGVGFNTVIQGTQVFLSAFLSNDTWYHLVFVYTKSAGTIDIYRDGSLLGRIAGQSTALAGSTESFTIGNDPHTFGNDSYVRSVYYDGLIDEMTIWSRALTSEEVARL